MYMLKRIFTGRLSILFALILSLAVFALPAFADGAAVDPNTSFFTQVFGYIQGFGGMSWMLKVSGIVLLVVASMKVSFLQPIWNAMGAAQAWVAPALGLIGGVLSLGTGGSITLPALTAYILAGGGAVFLHEILDTVKAIPGLGAVWVSLISVIEQLPFFGSGPGSATQSVMAMRAKKLAPAAKA